MQAASTLSYLILAGYLLGLLFVPEDRGSIIPQNFGELLSGYMVRYSRSWYCP
jgi:hypothetical protein